MLPHEEDYEARVAAATAPKAAVPDTLATIKATQHYLVDVIRSFGDVNCAAYISTWHQPDRIASAIAAATPSPVPADTAELPPLPDEHWEQFGQWLYSADQMRNYARAALATTVTERSDGMTPSEGVAAPVEQPRLSTLLWRDLKSDADRANWLLMGRGYETGVIAHALQNDVAMAYHRLAAQPSADQVEPKRKILPEPGSTKPEMLLYIDAINGEQVSRDDLWIVTTEVVNRAASADQVRDAALAECEAICNNVHDQYHAQRLIRELRASGEKGADRG